MTLHRKCVLLFKIESFEEDLRLISRMVRQFEKSPSHLVVVIGNEDISYKDLGKVVVWCMAAGISFLSFYDFKGILKKKETDLCKIVAHLDEKYSSNIIWGQQDIANGTSNLDGARNGLKNGYENTHKVHVNCFSMVDGKGSILNVVHQLCKDAQENKIEPADIDQDKLDTMIRNQTGVPDPDFAVICGSVCSTYGLLPWQIRITEFVQVNTHHNMTAEDFVSILHKYSKCVQRFGK